MNTAPAITTQPTNQTTCAGTSVSFSVTATGTGLTYQWRKGAVNIGGATASTYTIEAPIVGDAGSYDVVVSGTCAPAVTSSAVTLTIDIPSAPITGTITQPTCIVSTGSVILSGLPAGNWIINPGSVAGNTVSTTLSGLASGTYVFTVTNASGCTSPNSGTLVINAQPVPPAQAILNIIQPTCSLATGTVTVTSPTGPYEYNIDGGVFQASVIFSGVATGSHIILVRSITDNTCVSASSAAIINAQPASPSVTISNPAAVCSTSTVDLTDAAITAGSTSGLTYTYWSDPAGTIPYTTPATATSGTYYIKGTNVSGCSDIKPVVVTVTSSVNISSLTTNIFCSGTSTGSINITVTGGTTPYSFAWTGNGVNTGLEDQSGLSAGIYSVVVTDALSCVSLPLSVTITEPSPLAGNVTSQTNVSVSGGSDGSVTIAGAGGTSPYQYRLGAGPLQPGGVFSNLTAGNYTFTVQDFNLCSFIIQVVITQPSAALTGSITAQTNVVCFGASTGSVAVTGSDGTTPYEYSIDSGPYQSSGIFSSIPAGNHLVTIRDALHVTFDVPFTITQPSSAPGGSIINQVNILCSGGSQGSVVVSGSGGTPPYLYKLESGNYQVSGSFSDLYAGSYTITVQDASLCTSDISVTITEPGTLTLDYTSEDASCQDIADGTVDLNIDGGTQPITVLWPDGNTTVSRQDLLTGTYRVIITDANGCTASQDVIVGLSEISSCLSVQEIITPNNDGFYDTWKIKNIEMFPNAEVHVFNRWGERVFRTRNIPENEWDGKFNGKLLPTDSYHYVLYLNNGSDPITGIVTIIR